MSSVDQLHSCLRKLKEGQFDVWLPYLVLFGDESGDVRGRVGAEGVFAEPEVLFVFDDAEDGVKKFKARYGITP